ncbi:outer membrane beta-barrel protein [Bacteroides ihuae]|uniref:outer membrane beta-barrel protein n=1 Tax=Bacteroides ihuae TaxID=1852362 RepID=UPI00098FB721|nr:outer membrane beta-barrel protein [Bacteroides ihuae]
MINRMMMCICTNLAILFPLSAQTVSGRVLDKQNSPLEGINTVILQAKDSTYITGGITDATGRFSLPVVTSGKLILQFSSIGYQKHSITFSLAHGSKKQIGDVTLSEDSYLLSGVTVTAQKPEMELTSSTTVVNLSSSVMGSQGTLFDALKRLPGVQVRQDGTILLNGQTGATVMINGKLTYLTGTSLVGYLQTIPASSIGKIELVSTPSAQYDASGKSGLIKIEMSKNSVQGILASINTGYQQLSNYGRGNGGFALQVRKNKLNLSANYAYYQGIEINPTVIFRDHTDYEQATLTPVYLNQLAHRTYDYKYQSFKIGVDYDLSPRLSVGAYSSKSWNNQLRKERMASTFLSARPQADSTLTTWNRNRLSQSNQQGGMNATYKSAKKLEWNTFFDFQTYNSSNKQAQQSIFHSYTTEEDALADTLSGRLKANIHIYSLQTNIEMPLTDKLQFSAGAKTAWVEIDNITQYENMKSGIWAPDLSMSNRFIYNEDVYAGYSQLQGQIGKASHFELGLRVEHTRINGKLREDASKNDSTFRTRYTQLFPFMKLEHRWKSDYSLALIYGSRIVRPNYQDMNPFMSINDKYLYEQGNVHLKPELIQNIEVALMLKKQYRMVLFGTYTQHPISKSYRIDDENRAWVYPLNLSSDYAYGTRLTAINLHPLEWWTLNSTATCTYKKYAWITNDEKQRNKMVTPMIYCGNQFRLTHGWNAEASGYWNGKTPMGQATIKSLWSVSVGVSKSLFGNKGSLRLFVDDALSSRYIHINLTSVKKEAWYKERKQALVGISFSYKFHQGGEVKDSHAKSEIIESKRINLQK